MTDYTELKRLAEAAPEGPWYQHGGIKQVVNHDCETVCETFEEDGDCPTARFIAAANPAAVLALIAENERLHAMTTTTMGVGSGEGSLFVHGDYDSIKAAQAIVIERDQLKAENAGLRTGYQAYERVNAELKAEIEVLRKDADKWKSVQSAGDQLLSDEGGAAIWSACSRVLISVASELNSGRSVVTQEGVTIGDREIGDWRVTVERIDAAMGKGEQS